MAQFQYTAVSNDGKKLSGIIGALNEDSARKQLNTFGISILGIQKVADTGQKTITAEPETSKGLGKFEFEAYDKAGQKVLGTIPASSRYKAFKRLMDEYKFEVAYVVPLGATPEEKEKAKNEGLQVLKAEYEATMVKTPDSSENETNEAFERKRQALLKKVDFILEKIKSLLTKFATDIKPENKKIIENYMDKLLRIKSSTNLDYIEHTSEELLKKVQDQELFLHKEKMETQRASLRLESQKLMAELHSRPSDQKDISDDIENIQKKLNTSENKLLKGISQFLQQFISSPEEKELKSQINAVNKQVWTFRKIWFLSPKETKAEAKSSLESILEERNRLKRELKAMRSKKIAKPEQAETQENQIEPLITEEVAHFLGWLMGLYLIAYFASHYFLAKEYPGGNPLPGDFNLLSSGLLRTLMMSIFLWYILLSLRLNYLRYKSWANLMVVSIGILINATLVFNL